MNKPPIPDGFVQFEDELQCDRCGEVDTIFTQVHGVLVKIGADPECLALREESLTHFAKGHTDCSKHGKYISQHSVADYKEPLN